MNQKKSKIFLYSIFLVTVIPVIYVYFEHAYVEKEAFEKATTETKKIKTLSEFLLFWFIGYGYMFTSIFMIFVPRYRIPYLIIIVGTVAINFLYYFRIFGIPIPFTEIVITDLTTDWRDVVTKIGQQILVIPATALLMMRNK